MDVSAIVGVATGVVGGLAGVAGLVISWRTSRTVADELYSKAYDGICRQRLELYPLLWDQTNSPLDADGRSTLAHHLVSWYYTGGAGMLLSEKARVELLALRDALLDREVGPKPSPSSSAGSGTE